MPAPWRRDRMLDPLELDRAEVPMKMPSRTDLYRTKPIGTTTNMQQYAHNKRWSDAISKQLETIRIQR